MTVASSISRVSYNGDGATTVFPIPIYFLNNADIYVYLQDNTTGTVTLQALGTNYTLSGVGVSSGGSCTFLTAPASGVTVTIYRDPPDTQTTSYNNNDPFPAKSHENALDKLTMLVQRDRDLVSRSIRLPDGEGNTNTVLAPIATRKNKLFGFDTNGALIYPLGPNFVSNTLSGVAEVDTTATAQTTTFPVGTTVIKTSGLAAPEDGGAADFIPAPTGSYDIQTGDGSKWKVGSGPYSPNQFAVIGDVDDRTAFQAALTKLQDGDTFHFRGIDKATIVNGVGTGADAWAQRANAVANGGLRALTCAANNITVIIDGQVTATTPLDDLFRFTGKNVTLTGSGLIEYTGSTFIDTNAAIDPTNQWYPTLAYLPGDSSGVDGSKGLRFRRPPCVSVRIDNHRGFCRNARFAGGPTTYQPNGNNGTEIFHIYAGPPSGIVYRPHIEGNWFEIDTDGGKAYSDVFNTATELVARGNTHNGSWEHAYYSYGLDTLIDTAKIQNTVHGAIQIFALGAQVKNTDIQYCAGGILLMHVGDAQISGTKILRTTGSGIAMRTIAGEPNTFLSNDILIDGCDISIIKTGSVYTGSPIDIQLDNPYDNITIVNNALTGGSTLSPSTEANVRVEVTSASASDGYRAVIVNNVMKNADDKAVYIQRAQDFKIGPNKINVANGASGNFAIYGLNCTDGDIDFNTVMDGRGTKVTAFIADFSDSSNASIRARGNNLIGGLSSSALPIKLPSDSASWSRENTFDGAAFEGTFTTVAFTSFSIGGSGSTISNNTAASLRVGATVMIYPISSNAWTLQQSTQALYVSGVANGQFTVTSLNSTSVPAGAIFGFRIVM